MTETKKGKTSEIRFFDVDAEMFRRELVDYANELFKDYCEANNKAFEIKRKLVTIENKKQFNNLSTDLFWAEQDANRSSETLRLIDYLLQRLGFKLTDFNHITPDLMSFLKKGGGCVND